jgi:type II secretory ATPase GspE/PulE/Tfp pilus assembly ATPase PilB-like protein
MAAIRKTATDEGMKTLLRGGILKILRGETDLIEMLSICMR